jgi:DNA polymerase
MEQRGVWQDLSGGVRAFVTVHSSWVLRQRGEAARHEAYAGFVEDLSLLRGVRLACSPSPIERNVRQVRTDFPQ